MVAMGREALLDHYASLLPGALDALDATERHKVYKMLRVEAAICANGSLEVSGDVLNVCKIETSSI